MRKAIDLALAARPDLLIITGDFACGPHGRTEFQRQLRRLVSPLGVYAVLGNHDHGDSKAPFVQPTDPRLLEECGIRLLTNEVVDTLDDACLRVAWYRKRWLIEQLFRCLKTQGFNVEESQLAEGHALMNLTTAELIAAFPN